MEAVTTRQRIYTWPFDPVDDVAVSFEGKMTHVPEVIYLMLAVLIFSSSSSVYVMLNDLDAETFTPCNVLCAASTYGVVFMVAYLFGYKKSVTWNDFRSLPREDLGVLLVGSILYSVVGPFFLYLALTTLSVPAASILQRLEGMNFLVLSYLFLEAEISRWALFSASFTLAGVLLALFWDSMVGDEASYPLGILWIILSGWGNAGSLLLTKKYLSKCNTGLVAIGRVVIGTILYHILSVSLGDSDRLYTAKVWVYTLPYGFVYVFLGQVSWVTALKVVKPVPITVGTSALFALNLAWAAGLLSSYPTTSQWVGAAFIVTGISSSLAETLYKDAHKAQEDQDAMILGERSDDLQNSHFPGAKNRRKT